jgi:hypothetical protein
MEPTGCPKRRHSAWAPIAGFRSAIGEREFAIASGAAASVSERHPFFLLRAERGLAGPSPIRFSPGIVGAGDERLPGARQKMPCFAGSFT